MTIEEFIEELDDWNDGIPKVDYFVKKLEDHNQKFFDEISYWESLDNSNAFYSDEVDVVTKHKNCMFFKNNNFREYFSEHLCNNNKQKPHHEYKSIRDKISSKLKNEAWKKIFGSKKLGKCPVILCNNVIEKKSFHCGHVISCCNNGQNELDNLRPICGDCNSKMSSKNWDQYENEKMYETRKKKCSDCKTKIKSIDKMKINDENIYCFDYFYNLSESSSSSDNSSSDSDEDSSDDDSDSEYSEI